MESSWSRSSAYVAMKINRKREGFLSSLASVFAGTFIDKKVVPGTTSSSHQNVLGSSAKSRSASPSVSVLAGAGINTYDHAGWTTAVQMIEGGVSES